MLIRLRYSRKFIRVPPAIRRPASPCNIPCPPFGSTKRLRHRNNVVLPEPLGPRTQTFSPRRMLKSTPCNTSRPAKVLCIPRASKTGAFSASASDTPRFEPHWLLGIRVTADAMLQVTDEANQWHRNNDIETDNDHHDEHDPTGAVHVVLPPVEDLRRPNGRRKRRRLQHADKAIEQRRHDERDHLRQNDPRNTPSRDKPRLIPASRWVHGTVMNPAR